MKTKLIVESRSTNRTFCLITSYAYSFITRSNVASVPKFREFHLRANFTLQICIRANPYKFFVMNFTLFSFLLFQEIFNFLWSRLLAKIALRAYAILTVIYVTSEPKCRFFNFLTYDTSIFHFIRMLLKGSIMMRTFI